MIKYTNRKELLSIDEIKTKYKEYIVLINPVDDNTGYVYAYSDWDDIGKLTEFQIKMLHDENVELRKIRNYDTTVASVYIEKTGVL